jgi:hypothetical protein
VKSPSPLLGFNNNVRHKGRVFHIQTEDSGVKHPHIITHLFADGGRILKTTKTSYADHLGEATMAEKVRAMMQEQHKAMFIALRDGQFDHLIDLPPERPSAPGPAPSQPGAAGAPSVRTPSVRTPSLPTPSVPASSAKTPAVPASSAKTPAAPVTPVTPVTPAAAAQPPPLPTAATKTPSVPAPAAKTPAAAAQPPPLPAAATKTPSVPAPAAKIPSVAPPAAKIPSVAPPAAKIPSVAPPAAKTPSVAPPAAAPEAVLPKRASSRPSFELSPDALQKRSLSPAETPAVRPVEAAADRASSAGAAARAPIDLDALERAAEEVHAPFIQQIQDLPPPPAAVLAKRPSQAPSGSYRAVSDSGPMSQNASGDPGGGAAGRHAQPRPASLFGSARPAEGMSIFGEDLISEKSLDEVILSYLAEDLETPDKK